VTQTATSTLSCIVPIIVTLLVVGAIFLVLRRLIFLTDELALVTLMFNGLREVLGQRRSSIGCLMIAGVVAGFVLFVVLLLINTGTCFGDRPSEFCRLFPVLGQ
jgi:hypothetical protein